MENIDYVEGGAVRRKQKMTWRHYGFVFACAAMEFVCIGAWFNCAGIFYNPVANEFGIGLGQVGIYVSISFFSTMVVLPYGGRLLERANARMIYAATNALLFAAFLLNALAPNVYVMYVSGLLAGAMGAFDMYLLPVMIARWFKERMGFVVGAAAALSGIGAATLNIAIAAVITTYGWRIGYAVIALLVLILVIPSSIAFVRSYPEEVGVRSYGAALDGFEEKEAKSDSPFSIVKVEGADFSRVVQSISFYLMILMAMTAGLAVMMSQYLTSYALDVGYATMVGAAMTSAASLGNMGGKVVFGAFADRNITLAVIGPVVFPIIGFIGLMVVGGANSTAIVAMAFLYGTIQCSNVSILPLAVRHLFGDKDYGRIWSIISACSSFACGVGSSIWGFVYDVSNTFFGVFTVGIILLLIRLVAYLIALPVARRIPHSEEVRKVAG